MTRDYASRGKDRARYLFAGQASSHMTPYRNTSQLRPDGMPDGIASPSDLDFMNRSNPFFFTDRALHSAGQYIGRTMPLPVGTFSKRSGNTILFDSGGLQFGRDPRQWQGDASRAWALRFLEANADEAITLDVPTRVIRPGTPPFDSFAAALAATVENNLYFARHRSADVKFLSVLQGETSVDAVTWYDAVKVQPFEGWAFGGSMRTDYIHITAMMLRLISDGLLTPERNRLHFLGVGTLTHAVMLSALQKALREHLRDDDLLITFDTSSPSHLATNGKIYGYPNISSTSFVMSILRPPADPVHQEWRTPFPVASSRIGERLLVSDLCVPAITRQAGWDALGHEIVVNHNHESLLRGIDDANAIMEMPSAWSSELAPDHIIKAYRALRTMFRYPDPLTHVHRQKAAFTKVRGGKAKEGEDE